MAEQNFRDFWTRYSNLCLKCRVCPLKSVIKHMRGTTLCCQVERIRSEHWQFLLSALSVDNSLTEVCFKSELPTLEEQKELWKKRRRKKDESYPIPYGYSPQNISDICKYSFRILTASQTLEALILDNLPITKEDAGHLAEGLSATLIKEFAFRNYPYSDEVMETVCKGLGNSNVFLLDLSACNLSLRGLNFLCDVIKKHQIKRVVEAFPHTLRYRTPIFEEIMGLTRIILNGNNIGDKGVDMICDTICDDRWIQALDLQCCGISNDGAMALLKQITKNTAMQVVDLRLNEIDDSIIERITMQLGVNSFGKIINYTRLPLWKPRLFYKNPARKNKVKAKVMKKYSKLPKLKKEFKSLEHAFRISCEIFDSKDPNTEDACVQTVVSGDIMNLQERVKTLELQVLKEISMRESLVDLLEKFKVDNSKLRRDVIRLSNFEDVVMIDHETYSDIKHVFEKFQRFLKLMKDYKLWGLATTIGVAEYENTILEPDPSCDSIIRLMRKEPVSPDGSPPPLNGPVKAPPGPKPQARCCSCRKPECISNQKAEKENYASRKPEYISNQKAEKENNALNLNQKKPPVKSQYNAKVTKCYKDLRDTCKIRADLSRPVPRLSRKLSFGDLPSGYKHVPTTMPFKRVPITDIPNKFTQINGQHLYDAIKIEMDREKPSKSQIAVNNKNYYRNVSSQTAFVESLSSYNDQKANPINLSGNASSQVSQKSETSAIRPFPREKGLQPAANLFQRGDHGKQEYKECFSEPRGIAFGAASSKPILTDPQYFQNRAFNAQRKPAKPTLDELIDRLPISPTIASDYVFNDKAISCSSGCLSEQEIKKMPSQSTNRDKYSNNPKESTIDASTNKGGKSLPGKPDKSYSDSVSNASTDNDVKSLSDKSNKSYHESASNASTSKDKKSLSGKSNKSYLESVSDASTNKDKSLFGKSNESYLESVDDPSTNKDVESLPAKSNKSYLESVSDASTDKDVESFPISDLYESFKSNPKSNNESSKVVRKPGVTNSNSSCKSSKRSQKQKKNPNQIVAGGGKSPKGNVSSSSVPSLSDITTVSSRHLNSSLVEQFF